MITISFKKGDFSALKNFLLNKEEDVSSLSFVGDKDSKSLQVSVRNSDNPDFQEVGFSRISVDFNIDVEELSENVNFQVSEDPENLAMFIIANEHSDEPLKIRVSPSTNKVQFFYGDIIFTAKAEYNSARKAAIKENPVLSFQKKDFFDIFGKLSNASDSLEWLSKKAAGINIVSSNEKAYAVVVTKSFRIKKDIPENFFHREYANTFVHDSGIVLLKDIVLDILEKETHDDETIKIFMEVPVTTDNSVVSYNIGIGSRCSLSFNCIPRKKVVTITNSEIIPFYDEKAKTSANIPLEGLKKFFNIFKGNPIFLSEVLSLDFNASKGTLTIKQIDAENELFNYIVHNCKISKDASYELNFYCLEKIVSKISEENVVFEEKASNANRVVVRDSTFYSVVGKVLKQQ